MKKVSTIIAIGGGKMYASETMKIDREVVNSTGKIKPKALFIPTASGDNEEYRDSFKRIYGDKLGCRIDYLLLVRDKDLTSEIIAKKILSSDLIYVSGGNTKTMMRIWKKHGVDELLKQAYSKKIVLAGMSAGAIGWFNYGFSDSIPGRWMKVSALGLVNTIACPHFNEMGRMQAFKKFIEKSKSGTVGIGIDDNSALVIKGIDVFIVKSKPKSNIYSLHKNNSGQISIKAIKNGSKLTDYI